MGKIIQFTPVIAKGGSKEKTPEEVRKFMLGIEDPEEDMHIDVTFIPLDDERTALVGDFDDVKDIVFSMGDVQEKKSIKDPKGNKRGPGVIMTVAQTLRFVKTLEDDGWELNPEVLRVAQLRFDAMYSPKTK